MVLAVVGFIGSFLTAIYTFRMIFRAFWGEPSSRRASSSRATSTTAEHTNPATGEVEDTEVGFPGPDHHIAEREGSMKFAMGAWRCWRRSAARSRSRASPTSSHNFLEPTFADSKFDETSTVGPG